MRTIYISGATAWASVVLSAVLWGNEPQLTFPLPLYQWK